MTISKNRAAVLLGRRGGLVKSAKKTEACRRNGMISALKRRLAKKQARKQVA